MEDALSLVEGDQGSGPDKVVDVKGIEKSLWVQCSMIFPMDFDPDDKGKKGRIAIKLQHAFFGPLTTTDLETISVQISRHIKQIIEETEEAKR